MVSQLIYKWYLEHVNPSQNKNKFYSIVIYKTVNGNFEVLRNFGRIGSNPTFKPVAKFATYAEALTKAEELVNAKRFSNKDTYDMVSKTDNTHLLNTPKPVVIEPEKPFVIEPEKPVEDSYWSSLVVA